MSAVTWAQQTGDPRRFALRLALVDSDAADAPAGPALRSSWGLFELWADGVNLCAHEEQGEQLQAAHWYLLPLAEWLIDNWNSLMHEQRLPVPEISGAAATATRAAAQLDAAPGRPPAGWGLPAPDGDSRLAAFQDWSLRHRLASASPEAPLPEVWIRRSGSDVEISTGLPDTSLFDGAVLWTAPPAVARVPLLECARVLERSLRALLAELVERGDAADRAEDALRRLDSAQSPSRDDERLAWLVGLAGDTEALAGLREAIDDLDPALADGPADQHGVLAAVPVATLFGSLTPNVAAEDVGRLIGVLRNAAAPPGLNETLDALAEKARADDFADLGDGEAGGELGDALADHLPQEDGRVDIAGFVDGLGITVTAVPLSDGAVRAVTLLHDDGRAAIALNSAYDRGTAAHVVRFSLAHELAHLIYDRAAGRRLAIASGPWTPRYVERRANGFAAGLLMPERFLRHHTGQDPGWPDEPAALARVASVLGVGVTALAERLKNVGMLSRSAADALVDGLLQP